MHCSPTRRAHSCGRDSYIRAAKKPVDVYYDLPGMAEKMGGRDMTGYSFGPSPADRDSFVKATRKCLDVTYDVPDMVEAMRRDPRGSYAFKNSGVGDRMSYITPHVKEVIRREPHNVPGMADSLHTKRYGAFHPCCSACTAVRSPSRQNRASSAPPRRALEQRRISPSGTPSKIEKERTGLAKTHSNLKMSPSKYSPSKNNQKAVTVASLRPPSTPDKHRKKVIGEAEAESCTPRSGAPLALSLNSLTGGQTGRIIPTPRVEYFARGATSLTSTCRSLSQTSQASPTKATTKANTATNGGSKRAEGSIMRALSFSNMPRSAAAQVGTISRASFGVGGTAARRVAPVSLSSAELRSTPTKVPRPMISPDDGPASPAGAYGLSAPYRCIGTNSSVLASLNVSLNTPSNTSSPMRSPQYAAIDANKGQRQYPATGDNNLRSTEPWAGSTHLSFSAVGLGGSALHLAGYANANNHLSNTSIASASSLAAAPTGAAKRVNEINTSNKLELQTSRNDMSFMSGGGLTDGGQSFLIPQ